MGTRLAACPSAKRPGEPLELWTTPPFEPALRDGKLFARGVSDDKGQFVYRLFAVDAILAEYGELPCTIKWVLEGEEEVSSAHLHEYVEHNLEKLAGDACIWEFGGVDHTETPVEYLGLRGICYVELSVETGSQDAHSGIGGTIFPNAAWRLTWALATLKGPDEHIRIPGFYDDIVPPWPRDLELLERLPDSEHMRQDYGLKAFLKGLGGADLRREEVPRSNATVRSTQIPGGKMPPSTAGTDARRYFSTASTHLKKFSTHGTRNR